MYLVNFLNCQVRKRLTPHPMLSKLHIAVSQDIDPWSENGSSFSYLEVIESVSISVEKPPEIYVRIVRKFTKSRKRMITTLIPNHNS